MKASKLIKSAPVMLIGIVVTVILNLYTLFIGNLNSIISIPTTILGFIGLGITTSLLASYWKDHKNITSVQLPSVAVVPDENKIDGKYPGVVIAKLIDDHSGIVVFYVYRARTCLRCTAVLKFGDDTSMLIKPEEGRLVKVIHEYKHRGNYIPHITYKSPYNGEWVTPEVQLVKVRKYKPTLPQKKPVVKNTPPTITLPDNTPPTVAIDTKIIEPKVVPAVNNTRPTVKIK